ncbi:hypothetical protein [uncultured Rubinisphaera sp.]|uniref:hypothetical protein n=1 Tax=uncultured Rubinisphaera sp. TaxID=1678686 RepID=UPI000ED831D7|nr:hypothetical protein [Planctomycetaceae bacterium]|tara:strand:- start:207 stop:728 length:522 start_codon:yes stop_codon:yes gene_type:complete
MLSPNDIFLDALAWFVESYDDFTFYTERDLVWTIQSRISKTLTQLDTPLRVFNDYPILRANRRSLCVDIAIMAPDSNRIELAAEFKYEPDHSRTDIPKTKFPVVFWGKDGVAKDIERAQQFVNEKQTLICYTIFVDEGGAFRHRDPHPNSTWESWGDGRWALRSCAASVPIAT